MDNKIVTIKELKIGGFSKHDFSLRVADTQWDNGSDVAVALGNDFLSKFTTEFDLSAGVIRFLQPQECEARQLVHWRGAFSAAALSDPTNDALFFQTDVVVNGRRLRAWLVTSSTTSIITTQAADDLGIHRDDTNKAPGVLGITHVPLESWLGRIDTFEIWGELVRNATLKIVDLFRGTHPAHSCRTIGAHPSRPHPF